MQCLDDLFEDRLHPRAPLVPQPFRDAHDGVGRAVTVGENPGVEQVDAGRAVRVRKVDHPNLVGQ